jgi:hypothetical protein
LCCCGDSVSCRVPDWRIGDWRIGDLHTGSADGTGGRWTMAVRLRPPDKIVCSVPALTISGSRTRRNDTTIRSGEMIRTLQSFLPNPTLAMARSSSRERRALQGPTKGFRVKFLDQTTPRATGTAAGTVGTARPPLRSRSESRSSRSLRRAQKCERRAPARPYCTYTSSDWPDGAPR